MKVVINLIKWKSMKVIVSSINKAILHKKELAKDLRSKQQKATLKVLILTKK